MHYLSMMGNPAAPSFLNDGTFHDYVIYRLYLLAQISTLTYLDDRMVEEDEKQEAMRMYYKNKDHAGEFSRFASVEAGATLAHEEPESLTAKIKFQWNAMLRKVVSGLST